MTTIKRFSAALALAFGLLALTAGLVAAQGAWINGQDASYVIGAPDMTTSAGGATQDRLASPKDVAIDSVNGKLYVVDSFNNRVLRFSYPITANQPSAEVVFGQAFFTTTASGNLANQMNGPRGVAVDASGRLWVSESTNNRIVWFDDAYAISSNQPNADGVLGQPVFGSSVATTTQTGLRSPYDIEVSLAGDLYVADALNQRVVVFRNAAGLANGAPADLVLGQADFTSAVVVTTPTASTLSNPRGLTLWGNTLWVAERDGARVVRFDLVDQKTNGASADGVLGQPDFIANTRSISPAGMEYPSRLAVDPGGRLYVSDGFNADRIVIFENAVALPDGAPADYVLGQADFTSSGPARTASRFNMDSSGAGLIVDPIRNLLIVGDDGNDRVLVFEAGAALGLPALAIDKSGPAQTTPGNPVTYTLSFTNSGTAPANGLVITDVVPAGAAYVSGGTLMPGNVVSWTLPGLAIGASAQVDFVVTTTQTITNSDYGVLSVEGVVAQGSRAVTTEYLTPQLAISLSGPDLVLAGNPITYVITVSNTGTLDATNLVITNQLPVGAIHVSGGTLLTGNVVSFSVPGLAMGSSIQLELSVTADRAITNADYQVTSAEGVTAVGQISVTTSDGWKYYFPQVYHS